MEQEITKENGRYYNQAKECVGLDFRNEQGNDINKFILEFETAGKYCITVTKHNQDSINCQLSIFLGTMLLKSPEIQLDTLQVGKIVKGTDIEANRPVFLDYLGKIKNVDLTKFQTQNMENNSKYNEYQDDLSER